MKTRNPERNPRKSCRFVSFQKQTFVLIVLRNTYLVNFRAKCYFLICFFLIVQKLILLTYFLFAI